MLAEGAPGDSERELGLVVGQDDSVVEPAGAESELRAVRRVRMGAAAATVGGGMTVWLKKIWSLKMMIYEWMAVKHGEHQVETDSRVQASRERRLNFNRIQDCVECRQKEAKFVNSLLNNHPPHIISHVRIL